MNTFEIDATWEKRLKQEFSSEYFLKLIEYIKEEKKSQQVYPPEAFVFNAFNQCPFDQVKVVIIGQDPYHGTGQAHGLSFSVPEGIKPPPSLVNIFKELHADIGKEIPRSGNLEHWAAQGVLLLNATLTVNASTPGSHQKKGWEEFTDAVIREINEEKSKVVFLLWGAYAQKKGSMIDAKKHLVLKAPHPSPFSAYTGFLGCKHFSQTNSYLKEQGLAPIEW